MSQSVDYRIVEMRFDNKKFEAGAKETMGTLGRLKEALKLPDTAKALEGIDKATKNISLDGIASGVEALNKRFSTLGIVGMRVIENITDGLMNKVAAAVNFVSDSIVSGGIKRAMNIENAHFQLQALLKDEVKVQEVMDNAMESVDGTAYAYDEAAKAASQFAASGIQAGESMLNALKGITGVAAMTNSDFESISRIFTTIAGNGRLMGDQLLQLSSRGLNAASTIAEYFREVRGEAGMTEATIREMVSDGQISFKIFSDAMTWAFGDSAKRANETFTGSMSNMKSALARIGAGFVSPLVEQNGELVQLFNALRIKINDVKSSLVFDEQRSAISGLADVTKMSNEELSDMFSTIKTNGSVSISDLDILSKKGANAYDALTKYVNGVTDGSIRASYAITTALNDLTNGTKVSTSDIRKFVEEGKINLATFTSAMEAEFGTEKTLSKQFTDWFLDHIHVVVSAINAADMTKPMEIFYYWVESAKNLVKGLLSVVSPVGKAFSDVFLAFNADDVITFSEAVERLTAKMKLSEGGAKDLHDVFEGLFSILKLGTDIFFALLGAIVPINKPVIEMSGGILGLAGSMGRGLTKFTKWIRSCDLLKRAFGTMSNGINLGMESLAKLIKIGKNFVNTISGMEGTTKLINAISSAFHKLGAKATPYIKNFINRTEALFKSLFNIEDINLDDVLNSISKAFVSLAQSIENFSFESIGDSFDRLKEKAKSLGDLAMSNKGVAAFVTNFKEFMEELREAFTLDNLLDRVEKVMEIFGKFFRWVKDTMAPAFEDFNIGSALAAGGGLGIIYAMIKAAKGFEALSKAFTSVPKFFDTMKGTLNAYQKELKADALLKTAAAIGVLAGALVLLSFADTDRLMGSAVALTLIAGTLMLGVSKLLDAINKGKDINKENAISNALTIFSDGLSKSMKKLATAVEIKALGGAIKSFGQTILMIAASIVALGLFYRKDPAAFDMALKTVAGIGLALGAIALLFGKESNSSYPNVDSLLSRNSKIAAIGKSLLMISASIGLIVLSISKLMKMELPTDYEKKLFILGGIIISLAGLAVVLGLAARISGGNQLPEMASTIKSLAILMVGTILAIKILFDMNIPDDYQTKLGILAGIFVGFGVLLVAMGAAARLSGGNGMKAAGTILSMALFLGVVVAALFVLTLIPGDKMLKGALALGGTLLALGGALVGAGKISDKETYKTVLAMALTIGVITAALAVLTMIPWNKLAVSVTALGAVLLVLALNFRELSKMDSAKSVVGVMAMMAATLTIAYALYTLSEQPWKGMLAAGGAMSVTLLAFAKAFDMIMERNWSQNAPKKIGVFALLVALSIPIAAELGILAHQPWKGLLSAGIAMSGTLMMFSLAYQQVLDKNWSQNAPKKMQQFAILVGLTVPIAVELGVLANQPWEGLLAGAVAMSTTMLALAAAFKLVSGVNLPNTGVLMALGALVLATIPIAVELGVLANQPWEGLLAAAVSLSTVLIAMAVVLNLCISIGAAAEFAITGAGVLLGFIIVMGTLMVVLGALFTKISNWEGYLDKGIVVLSKIGEGLGRFAGAIIGGIFQEISNSLPGIGENLSKFWDKVSGFFYGIAELPDSTFTNMILLAGALIAFTAAELIAGLGALVGAGMLIGTGVELSGFMIAASPFFAALKNIKPETVEAANRVVQMIQAFTVAELINGIGKLFGFTGNLAAFGEELKSFGPHIKKFAEEVKDVNPEAVQGAAAAAEIMAEVAKKLPAQSGLAKAIFGERSLAEFGEELKSFGPHIKKFAEEVKDVKPDAVEGAAAAAEIMANLANKLPPQSGLAKAIFGEKSLAEFGEELTQFGPKIAKFAEQVKNVNPAAVTGCQLVTTIMTSLANNLPSSDTLWNKIFGGGQVSLSEFGNELVKFGTSMSTFSSSISEIDPSQVNGIIDSVKSLIDLTNYVQGVSATELANFLNQFSQNSIQSFANGINAKKPLALSTVTNLCTTIINKFKTDLQSTTFKTFGENIVIWIRQGMDSKKENAKMSANQVCNVIIQAFKDNLSQEKFKEIGVNAALGLKYGIESKIDEIGKAAVEAAQEAVNSAKKALDEHSPSKKAWVIGEFFSLGVAGGIIGKIKAIAMASTQAADGAIDPAKDAVKDAVDDITTIIDSGDFDMDPVIRPVMDLSDVKRGVEQLGAMMNKTYDISSVYEKAMDASSSFSRSRRSKSEEESSTKSTSEGETKYEFIQNNYSPKALQRSEIYRQTNNQFAAFRRAVKPT